ncbi:hypothetical protein PILCRDRAFT_812383 [Piloderma croceum F 1598]|uniref:Uncharacterized protein n=1 Tax=Piloderma croceum (strain F 1598) TaxID=765440 RepID=A0A0C3CLV0_PILCF|nr:hypothetical protein PILCRDRAFT_812383 [Piloderma croceum F 1598]
MYHTGTFRTLCTLRSFIYSSIGLSFPRHCSAPTPQIQVSQAPAPDPFESRRSVPDCKSACMRILSINYHCDSAVCFPSAEEVAAAYALAFAVAQALTSLEALQSYSV